MNITDINGYHKLSLQIITEKGFLEIPISLVQATKQGILIKPVLIDQKIISFNNTNISIKYNIVCTRDNDKPCIWRGVIPLNTQIKGNSYVLIKIPHDGTAYNRRNAYRLPLDIQCRLSGTEYAILHDLSCNGMSFYLNAENTKEIGSKVYVSFDFQYQTYTIAGTIVRQVADETGNRVLYGCKIKPSPVVDTLINEMQRAHITKK